MTGGGKAMSEYTDKELKKLSGWDWILLLIDQPELADKCDFFKLSSFDWAFLLRHKPQFAEKCDFSKLSGNDWDYLLHYQPKLKKYMEAKR